jgi:hypothetical protein
MSLCLNKIYFVFKILCLLKFILRFPINESEQLRSKPSIFESNVDNFKIQKLKNSFLNLNIKKDLKRYSRFSQRWKKYHL